MVQASSIVFKSRRGGAASSQKSDKQKNKNLKIVKFLIRVGVGDGGVLFLKT